MFLNCMNFIIVLFIWLKIGSAVTNCSFILSAFFVDELAIDLPVNFGFLYCLFLCFFFIYTFSGVEESLWKFGFGDVERKG